MAATAREFGADPHDPAQNVDAGARYLRDLLRKYDGLLWHALAAYNAGPAAVDRYNNIPPYRETVNYIKRIDRDLHNRVDRRAAALRQPDRRSHPVKGAPIRTAEASGPPPTADFTASSRRFWPPE